MKRFEVGKIYEYIATGGCCYERDEDGFFKPMENDGIFLYEVISRSKKTVTVKRLMPGIGSIEKFFLSLRDNSEVFFPSGKLTCFCGCPDSKYCLPEINA